MAFYTAKGDDGTTGLLGEGRVPKYHDRMEALGGTLHVHSPAGEGTTVTATVPL